MSCRFCGTDLEPTVVPRPDTVYAGGELRCAKCGRHLGWRSTKTDRKEGKRKGTSQYTIEMLNKTSCDICQRPKRGLGICQTLEIHHIVAIKDGGEDRRRNIMVLCTACHKLVHYIRLYHNEHMQHMWPEEAQEPVSYSDQECEALFEDVPWQ